MKICIFGAGATGSHFAMLLARAGADVSLVARGAHLQAIRSQGLTLQTDDDTFQLPLRASDRAAELGRQDLVLVTLKSYGLNAAAAEGIAALCGPDTPVLFLQNGIPWWYHHGEGGPREGRRLPDIDPGGALWNAVGPHRVIGGITSSACTLERPGFVSVRGGNRALALGEPDGSDSPRLRDCAAWLQAAGFPVEVTTKIREAIWHKLTLNMGSGPLGVLAPVPMNQMFNEEPVVQARFRIQEEVLAIAAAMGCPLKMNVPALLGYARTSPHLPSIAQDALAGRPMELQTMFLSPLQMGREQGVPTPMLDLLVALCVMKARSQGTF